MITPTFRIVPKGKIRKPTSVMELLRQHEMELMKKAIEIAKKGDVQMMCFLLKRLIIEERTYNVEASTQSD